MQPMTKTLRVAAGCNGALTVLVTSLSHSLPREMLSFPTSFSPLRETPTGHNQREAEHPAPNQPIGDGQ
ncbi:unnamed protein product [Nezara viridula]|uniref:Uncharacterized protein n=1 Tax=Nezara viridula TaxID=85310 RepID=A0A9P0E7U1_NEZVI|nr:unnamed protein product [Nezara viridula]